MNIRKITAVLLVSVMLGSALTACSAPDADDTPETSDKSTESTAPAVTEPEETKIPSGLPKAMDLEGQVFTFYGKTEKGVYAEEENGESVNDAVYARNLALNEKYNFEILQISPTNQATPTKDILQNVQAGDDSYQVLIDGPRNSLIYYVSGNLLYDMNTLKYQDFDQPWWFHQLNDSLTLMNKLFMSANAFSLTSRQWLYHPIVNIDLMKDNGLDINNYYQMAYDGTWTLDEFIKLIRVGAADLNGDGVRDNNDRWGHSADDYSGYCLAVGAGYLIADKDENDIPYITAATEEAINLWDKLVNNIFADTTNYLCIRNIKNVDHIWTESNRMMQNDQLLVQISMLEDGCREYEINYGILPIPKANAEQENYIHTASCFNVPMFAVPISVKNVDDVSFVLEAMAYESYYNVLPVFYEAYLESKLARDVQSVDMLEIIHNTLVMDIGSVYNWGSYLTQIYKVVNQGKNTLVTHDASKRTVAANAIADLIATIQAGNQG
ncbi:MAG: hypothetical protein E7662_01225 [Ruminococcaceae bacterium]|nr:hypothetical protein [Oscillospiraceae bacterium]